MLVISSPNMPEFSPLVLDGAELESAIYGIVRMLSQATEKERRIVAAFVGGLAGKKTT